MQKEQGQYTAILTKQAWSIKDLLNGQKEKIFLRDQRGKSRAGKMGPYLARLGSQSERGIHYILPASGFSHIIKSDTQGVFRGTSIQRSLQTYGQVTNSQQGLIETGICERARSDTKVFLRYISLP